MKFLKNILAIPSYIKLLDDFDAKVQNEFSFDLFKSDSHIKIKSEVLPLLDVYEGYDEKLLPFLFCISLLALCGVAFYSLIALTPNNYFLLMSTVIFLMSSIVVSFIVNISVSTLIKKIEKVSKGLSSIEDSTKDLKELFSLQSSHPEIINKFKTKVFENNLVFNNYFLERILNLINSHENAEKTKRLKQTFEEFKNS